ncbi:hypothetical protein VTI74DRAFT_6248 [Chaetomium olivicolor]
MPASSSLFPRLGFSRAEGPILPLHGRSSPPIRKKPSEYDLSELSPQPDDDLLSPESMKSRKDPYFNRKGSSPSGNYSDSASNAGSASKSKPPQRILFAGPPPPIATSRILYRDEEDDDTSRSPPRTLHASSFARNINSVLFDRSSSSPTRTRDRDYDHKPDTVWLTLQRRERALQKELQHLLDAQSAGLAANLDPTSLPSDTSDAGASTTTPARTQTTHSRSPSSRRHVTFGPSATSSTTSGTTTPSDTLVPVRQPRPKPLGLRAARAGLARTIALLADLKAEEDAQLTAALSTRKRALSQLRRLSARREGIAEELRILESDEDEPLGRELRELETEREAVTGAIADLEERLGALRRRKTWLDGRVEEVRNKREAGLSGYRGALKEVEGRLGGMLGRPGVKPLDRVFFASPSPDDGEGVLGGAEFLRLTSERRTAEMAREWWEGEVVALERRKGEVDKERKALEEGVEVWKAVVKLVSEFEAGLRREMRGEESAETKGKGKGKGMEVETPSSPGLEQAMLAQLDKMRGVMTGLEEHLHTAEENGWNLLICAIGAELEAFKQAEIMLRDALRTAGFDVSPEDDGDQGGSTPHLGRSTSLRNSSQRDEDGRGGGAKLVDLHEGLDEEKEPESDNEVPPDLLVSAVDDRDLESRPALSREDSGNEVPIEFLREHPGEGYPGLGVRS